MNILKLTLLACAVVVGAALPTHADILIRVDQSTQRMSVDVDGQHLYDWRISTGRPGYDTPNGDFRPNRMDADHYSQEYDNAPMPHAIFFDLHGHAIHGSYDPIGHPAASHGCVRLDPANAAKLFDLVKQEGMANTKVEIGGDVTIALRNAKPSHPVSVARAQAHVRAASQEQVYGPPPAYNQPYYAPQPQQYYYQQYEYAPAPSQPAWHW
jgi:hypothetical protein